MSTPSTSHSTTLIGIASCVASFLAGVAYADGCVRASSRGPGIAVLSADGERFDTIDDAAVLRCDVTDEPVLGKAEP